MNPRGRLPKYQLSPLQAFLTAILLAGAVTLLALWCQPNALRAVLSFFRENPLLIVLNAAPVLLLLLLFTCLFGNVFLGAAVANCLVCTLSIVNRVKLEVRDEPLFPRDFALLREVGSAMGSYHIQYPTAAIALVLLSTLALIVLGLFTGCKSVPPFHGWVGRFAGAAASSALLAGLVLTLYASNDLYQSFPASNPYYIPAVFNDLGFPYCFCHHFTTYTVDKPEGYSRAEAESWETGDSSGQGKDVHVIVVMDEAFSDLTDWDAFAYPVSEDPLPNLHTIQKSAHCLSGHIVVPGFAGGTANTEFDILTGMQTNALSATTTSAFRAVNRNLDSLFRIFGQDGYATAFLHPGDNWFYNRENVYRWFGAQETIFLSDMTGVQYKGTGGWVSDDYLAGVIEDTFENACASGTPSFSYTTTIQNHMSYVSNKYGEGYDYPPVRVCVPLSEAVETMLEVYVEGARDADAMLGRLADYFSLREEPVVLVFCGDHLPYLGDGQLGYRELEPDFTKPMEERTDPLQSYRTPYVIWANDAGAASLDWEDVTATLQLPEDGTISACYLGAVLLELTGRGGESPWFSYLNEIRRELPVLQEPLCCLADGKITSVSLLSEEQWERIAKLRRWSYYKMIVKKVEP